MLSLQAAILNAKLPYLADWTIKRIELASNYTSRLSGVGDIYTPPLSEDSYHVFHLYTIRTNYRDQLRDFLYIDDAVNAIYKSLKSNKNNGEIINIGSQKPIKIRDLILKIIKLIGKGKPIFSKIKIRSDEPIRLYPDISKAKDILNWYPKFSLEKGLKKTINYYRKNGKKN